MPEQCILSRLNSSAAVSLSCRHTWPLRRGATCLLLIPWDATITATTAVSRVLPRSRGSREEPVQTSLGEVPVQCGLEPTVSVRCGSDNRKVQQHGEVAELSQPPRCSPAAPVGAPRHLDHIRKHFLKLETTRKCMCILNRKFNDCTTVKGTVQPSAQALGPTDLLTAGARGRRW